MIEAQCQAIKNGAYEECKKPATKRIRPQAPFFVCDECLKAYLANPNFDKDKDIVKEDQTQ